jgi:tRNA pseudouridine38-40 synthase
MSRWKAICAYEGTNLHGWQSQTGAETVQDHLEQRLKVISGSCVRIHASGRTDSGVHAVAHPFHFDLHWPHGPVALQQALNSQLPHSIHVQHLEPAEANFHARFSAYGKRYCYYFMEGVAAPWHRRFCWELRHRKLDLERAQAAANGLMGLNDYRAYGANRGDASAENPVKALWRIELRRQGPLIKLTVEGTGFLYKMVRSLAGTLVAVGTGQVAVEQPERWLKDRVRTPQIATAPAHGLWLVQVFYPAEHAFQPAVRLQPPFEHA